MDMEGVDGGCQKCCDLQNEMEKKVGMMEQRMTQNVSAFLTLKQKVISTDKIITEYQSAKMECNILSRKNEEFSQLVDQLYRDLNSRNKEYSVMLLEIEALKKGNEEYKTRFLELEAEAQKWKYEYEAGKKFTTQLIEKVKILEKYEEELKEKSKECDRMVTKLEAVKGQLKESKDSGNDVRKELKKVQRSYAQVAKFALIWGQAVDAKGKLPAAQKRFFLKLKEGNDVHEGDSQEGDSQEETDKESKLLEQLLSQEEESGVENGILSPSVGKKSRKRKGSLSPNKSQSSPRRGKMGKQADNVIDQQSKLLEELLSQEEEEEVDPGKSSSTPKSPLFSTPSRPRRRSNRLSCSSPLAEDNKHPVAEEKEPVFASPKSSPIVAKKLYSVGADLAMSSDSDSSVHSVVKQNYKGPRTRMRSGKPLPSPTNQNVHSLDSNELSSELKLTSPLEEPLSTPVANVSDSNPNHQVAAEPIGSAELKPNSPMLVSTEEIPQEIKVTEAETVTTGDPQEGVQTNEQESIVDGFHGFPEKLPEHSNPEKAVDVDQQAVLNGATTGSSTICDRTGALENAIEDHVVMETADVSSIDDGIEHADVDPPSKDVENQSSVVETSTIPEINQPDSNCIEKPQDPSNSSSSGEPQIEINVVQELTPAGGDSAEPVEKQIAVGSLQDSPEVTKDKGCNSTETGDPNQSSMHSLFDISVDSLEIKESIHIGYDDQQYTIENGIETPKKNSSVSVPESTLKEAAIESPREDAQHLSSTLNNEEPKEESVDPAPVVEQNSVTAPESEVKASQNDTSFHPVKRKDVSEDPADPHSTEGVSVADETSKDNSPKMNSKHLIDTSSEETSDPQEGTKEAALTSAFNMEGSEDNIQQNQESPQPKSDDEKIQQVIVNDKNPEILVENSNVAQSVDVEKPNSSEEKEREDSIQQNQESPQPKPDDERTNQIIVNDNTPEILVEDSNVAQSVDVETPSSPKETSSCSQSLFDLEKDVQTLPKETSNPVHSVTQTPLVTNQPINETFMERQVLNEKGIRPKPPVFNSKFKPIAFQPAGFLQDKTTINPEPVQQPQPIFKVPLAPVRPIRTEIRQVHQVQSDDEDDDVDENEVSDILSAIRTTIRNVPKILSPLPRSPLRPHRAALPPPPPAPVIKTEPKFSFPTLPRCAFNWTAKKLPIDNQLNEKLGGIHPGVFARVRFRKVGALRIGPPTVDVLFDSRQSVVNFAEAERRRKPFIAPVQLPVESLPISTETVPTQNSSASGLKKPPLSKNLLSIDLSENSPSSFQEPAASNVPASSPKKRPINPSTVRQANKTLAPLSLQQANVSSAPVTKKPAPTVDLFGDSSSSDSESESSTSSPDPVNRSSKKSKPVKKIPPVELFGDSSTSESEEEQESPRSANMAAMKELPSQPSQKVTPAPTILPARREIPIQSIMKKALSVPEDSSTSKNGEEASPSFAKKPPSLLLQKVALASAILPIRRKIPTRSSVPETVPLKAKTQPRIVATSGTKVAKEVQPELTHSPGPSSSSDSLQIDLDPPHFNQVNKRITRASKRTLEGEKSSPPCVNPTPTKKARTPLEEHPPSPFPRPPPVVNKRAAKEAILPGVPGINVIPTTQLSVVSDNSGSESNESHTQPDNFSKDAQDDLMESSSPLAASSTDNSAIPKDVVEESPASPEDFESPQSPDDVSAPIEDAVVQIPTNDEPQLSAFEIASKVAHQHCSTPHKKASVKLRKVIHLAINKFTKTPDMTVELFSETVDFVLRPDSIRDPSIFIRHLMATVIRDADGLLDISMTPPAPPLVATQQRCIILLKAADEKRAEIDLTNTVSPHFYSDAFLSEVSSFMFQTNSSLTLEEMCALARTYTALARSRGLMSQARSFLYDCLYFFPPRSFALTYTILSVWTEVLRHVSFPTGLTAMDHTVAYLLLQCCKVKAVPGIAGKVLQMRSFMKTTLGHENPSCTSANELIVFLVSQLSKTHSVDEASSIHWSLSLLARWEGVDLAINIIEKHLWLFLQKWSTGDGTNAGAASAIKCIGALGKTVPAKKRDGVKKVLGAMKTILNSEEAETIIQEAAVEAVILLGEEEEPNAVIDVLKKWKPRSNPSAQLQKIMCLFLQRQSSQNDNDELL